MEKKIHQLQNDIDSAATQGSIPQQKLKQLGQLQYQFEHLDGYRLESEAKKILTGLGFMEGDWHRNALSFNGGWQMRMALARLLLQYPNILMLDEPTNHLDIQTTEWLENYLQNYDYAFILVSHDRYFLDKIITRVIEVADGKITKYWGNYSDYLEIKQKEQEMLAESDAAKITTTSPVANNPPAKKGKEQKRLEAEERNKRSRLRREHEDRMRQIETIIKQKETRKEEMETLMADPAVLKNGQKTQQIQIEYHEIIRELEQLYRDWEVVAERIDEIGRG